MCKNEKTKIEKTAKELMQSAFIQELNYRYPIEIFPNRTLLVVRIELRDAHGQQVDLIEVEMNDEGCVNIEQALDLIVIAWEMGLHNAEWEETMERIRQMKF